MAMTKAQAMLARARVEQERIKAEVQVYRPEDEDLMSQIPDPRFVPSDTPAAEVAMMFVEPLVDKIARIEARLRRTEEARFVDDPNRRNAWK